MKYFIFLFTLSIFLKNKKLIVNIVAPQVQPDQDQPGLVDSEEKESTRWSTYNGIKIALDYWDAISDEEWLEVDEEFKQRVVENSENPMIAIIRFLKRYDNLSEELLRLKSKVEGFVNEDKGFFRRLKERFRK